MRWAFLPVAVLGTILFTDPSWFSSCHAGYCHWILQLQEAGNITWRYSCYISCQSAAAMHSHRVFKPGKSPSDDPWQYSFQVLLYFFFYFLFCRQEKVAHNPHCNCKTNLAELSYGSDNLNYFDRWVQLRCMLDLIAQIILNGSIIWSSW